MGGIIEGDDRAVCGSVAIRVVRDTVSRVGDAQVELTREMFAAHHCAYVELGYWYSFSALHADGSTST